MRARKTFAGAGGQVDALAEVSLEVHDGEFVVVVGPSGCGKTTLLRLLAGFERPTSGTALAHGVPVAGPDPDRGFVFQTPALYPWLTVLENVELGLRIHGVGKRERRERALRHVDAVGLGGFANAAPYELSGGMQQRCQLARVLATEPSVLLMDEPFGALDAITREYLQEELRRLWVTERRTVVFVTHSVEEAVVLGTRAVVMARRPGRITLDLSMPFAGEATPVGTLRTNAEVLVAAEQLRVAIDAASRG